MIIALNSLKASVITSPNGNLTLKNEQDTFFLYYNDCSINKIIPEGLTTDKRNNIVFWGIPEFIGSVKDEYEMITGKKSFCSNEANEYIYRNRDSVNNPIDLIVRLYNDGLAFRYKLRVNSEKILEEKTSFVIPEGSNRWIMKWRDSYEEFFTKHTTGKDYLNYHWAFPVLTECSQNVFSLISEAGLQKGHSASSLINKKNPEIYEITYPKSEIRYNGDYFTPWRIIICGELSSLIESTLVTDVSAPSTLSDTKWIIPGTVSWIYWANNHGSSDYDIICRYVDMAQDLNLPYMLIDAEWDEMKNNKTVEDAVNYSLKKGVKPLIWYNSSTGWIEGAPGPKFRLNDPEKRDKEFEWCEK